MPDPVVPPVDLPVDLPPCLLQYGFSTRPAPLQVSAAAADSPGMVEVWVSAPVAQPTYCSKIVLAVPIGQTGTDLTEHTPSVTPNTTWWSVSSLVVESGDHLGLDAGTSYAVFTAVCPSNTHWNIDYDLAFSLVTAAVNTVQGTFGLVVAETSGPDPAQMQLRRDVFGLAKGPVVTYLTNVVTTLAPPESTTLPVTCFSAGQPIRLAWESNADSFAVYVGAGAQPVWSGPDTSTVLTAGVSADSTLTVIATAGAASLLGTVSITVSNPTLTPASLTAGSVAVGAGTTLAATTLASVGAGSLHAGGPATVASPVSAGSLQASGATALQGPVTLGSATVQGTLTAGSTAALGAAAAGTLQVSASATWLSPRSIGPGGYAAGSDGLVVGTVGYTGNAGQKCAAVAYGSSAGVGTVYALGGNVEFWTDSKKWSMWINPNSFVLPVRRGAGFSVGVMQVPNADAAAPTTFTWVPFGTSAALQALTDEELAGYGLDAAPVREPIPLPSPRVGAEVDELMAAVADVLGDRLTAALRDRLRAAVLDLSVRH